MLRRAGAIAPLIWLAAFTASALADFTFPDFSDITGLNLVGSATVIDQRLRLTPDLGEQAGAAWFITKQSVADGFATTFQVHIGVDGADGFAFVIQNHDTTAPGGCCGGQGYEFIPNSLAVEFDTWQNIPEDFPSGLGDPNENHISVQTRGLLPNSADPLFSVGTATVLPYLSDGQLHTVKITYMPGILRIFVDNLVTPALVVAVNLATILDLEDGRAWVGLTAGTGGVSEIHDMLTWSFTDATPQEIVNDHVTFEPIESTFIFAPDTTRCPTGFVGTFSFEAKLTNTSTSSLSNLIVEVTELTGGNLLQNADGGPEGVGAHLTVPRRDGFTNGILSPDEFVDVPFLICLTEREPFRFMVDVLGSSAPTCMQPPEGLVSWWPGDGGADDIVGARNGSVVGSTRFAPGIVGEAFSFDGGGWVDVPDDPIWTLSTENFSIDLWVRFDSLSGRDPFIAHDNGGGEEDKWIFWYDTVGHDKQQGTPALRFHINSPHPEPVPFPHDTVVAPWNPILGRWYHVAVTRRGINYSLYIDGAQVATDTSTFSIPDPVVPLTIGRAEAYTLDGLIDEVEIFDRALSDAEIHAIFTAGSAGKCKE